MTAPAFPVVPTATPAFPVVPTSTPAFQRGSPALTNRVADLPFSFVPFCFDEINDTVVTSEQERAVVLVQDPIRFDEVMRHCVDLHVKQRKRKEKLAARRDTGPQPRDSDNSSVGSRSTAGTELELTGSSEFSPAAPVALRGTLDFRLEEP